MTPDFDIETVLVDNIIIISNGDHLTARDRDMWFGDPFHVLPSELWDEFKASLAAETKAGAEAAVGGLMTVAGGQCLYMPTAQGAGRFLVWHGGTSQRIYSDSFLLALFPLDVVISLHSLEALIAVWLSRAWLAVFTSTGIPDHGTAASAARPMATNAIQYSMVWHGLSQLLIRILKNKVH